ncbi:MAG TPA: DUF6678 family protein [Rhizomicrobium sp.]|nr:DUF6678 family protein [Rhizomicrobium sp.]
MRQPQIIQKPSRKKIAGLFCTSQMSNAKWRKMFVMLGRHNANVGLQQAIIKFIDDENEHVIDAPDQQHMRTPWAYIDLHQGPVAFGAIEWIEYPRMAVFERSTPNGKGRISPREVAQDIDKAEAVLRSLGQYPLQRTERGLRIIGYVRQSQ